MAVPATYDITLYQGDTYRLDIVVKDNQATPQPVNITGWTARGQIRPTIDSATIFASFVVTFTNASLGQVRISLTGAITAAIPQNGVYDLEFTLPGGEIETYLKGALVIDKEVTR